MRTVAVTMVRDEADIVAATVSHMLAEVDAVIVADNLSADETPEILRSLQTEHPDRLVVLADPDPAYRQSAKMTDLARRARLELGAEWIVPFDADEWWYSPFGRIGDVLADVAPQWLVVPAPLYDHVATGRDVARQLDPTRSMEWRRREANPLPKVACRWRRDLVIEQGNHSATYDGRATRFDELLVVRHFPYRSVSQLVRKIRNGSAAYAAAGDSVPDDAGAHWREWGRLLDERGVDAIADLFRAWYYRQHPETEKYVDGERLEPLLRDPAPRSERDR